jgi:hypothetical protein
MGAEQRQGGREKRGQGPEREEGVNNDSKRKRLESQYKWMKTLGQ